MRVLSLSALAVAALALLGAAPSASALFDKRKHVGALNVGLREEVEQLQLNPPRKEQKEKRHSRDELFSEAFSSPSQAAPLSFFDQRVNHFDPMDNRTFSQQFMVNATFFDKQDFGPVLFMLGGEGPISSAYLSGHFIINHYAEQFGALMVAMEHRYYGQSVPNVTRKGAAPHEDNTDYHYLSSEQALADIAYFHEFISRHLGLPTNLPWIVFGGSYSGSMSAWARLKYPHLFFASISASAPVLAQLDFPEYFEVVQESLGPYASNILSKANEQIATLLSSETGKLKLAQAFNFCSPLQSAKDIANFVGSVSDPFAGIVQYSYDNNGQTAPTGVTNISALVDLFERQEKKGLSPFEIVADFVVASNDKQCLEVSYRQMIKDMKAAPNAGTSWTYQTCTEFGYYQTGEGKKQPFSKLISLEFFQQQCADLFGVGAASFPYSIGWTNDYYGAKHFSGSKTFFTHGSLDPWHILGITKMTNDLSDQNDKVFYINGTAHCADLYAASPNDVASLQTARTEQMSAIAYWLLEMNQPAPHKPKLLQF